MIFVKRSQEPPVFSKKAKKILEEIQKAKEFFAGPNANSSSEKVFTFYKANVKQYKEVLINMFNQRCAYCESIVTVTGRGDIEHFRPKGEFVMRDGKSGRPAYYWLAARWDNLYLSCTNCNQTTTLKVIDPKNPAKTIDTTVGKLNNFALKDETRRLKNETQLLEEEEPYRLLIDPCKDKPEQFLEFTKDGIVIPRNGDVEEMGLYSIGIYGLQRERLVNLRAQKYLQVMDLVNSVERRRDLVIDGLRQQSESKQHQLLCEEMEKDFLKLVDLLDANNMFSEYVGLARQFAEPFLQKHAAFLNQSLTPEQFGNQPWFPAAVAYFQPQLSALKSYVEKRQ